MFSVVRCPRCGNIQGAEHPVKTTRCRRCGKRINILKTGVLGIFEDAGDMRDYLTRLKWKGETSEAIELSYYIKSGSSREGSKFSRKGIKNMIMGGLAYGPRNIDELIADVVEQGTEKETVKRILLELHSEGLIYYPRHGVVDKT
jgi:hypothetical protein